MSNSSRVGAGDESRLYTSNSYNEEAKLCEAAPEELMSVDPSLEDSFSMDTRPVAVAAGVATSSLTSLAPDTSIEASIRTINAKLEAIKKLRSVDIKNLTLAEKSLLAEEGVLLRAYSEGSPSFKLTELGRDSAQLSRLESSLSFGRFQLQRKKQKVLADKDRAKAIMESRERGNATSKVMEDLGSNEVAGEIPYDHAKEAAQQEFNREAAAKQIAKIPNEASIDIDVAEFESGKSLIADIETGNVSGSHRPAASQSFSKFVNNAKGFISRASGPANNVFMAAGVIFGAADFKNRIIDKPSDEQTVWDRTSALGDVGLVGGGLVYGGSKAAVALGFARAAAGIAVSSTVALAGGGITMAAKGAEDIDEARAAEARGLTVTNKEYAGSALEVAGGSTVLTSLIASSIPTGWGALAGALIFGGGALISESGKEEGATADLIKSLSPVIALNQPAEARILAPTARTLLELEDRFDDEVACAVVEYLYHSTYVDESYQEHRMLHHPLLKLKLFPGEEYPSTDPYMKYVVPKNMQNKSLLEILEQEIDDGWNWGSGVTALEWIQEAKSQG
ncbi:MAG: hypothetical protein H7A32_01415 [Deltaproteobacteria bacterium]|nr:hypothetical protein [Deltaproteobacteria bacterium]